MAIKFQCPQCKKAFSVKDEYSGKKAKCPCGAKIVVPSATTASKQSNEVNVTFSQSHDFVEQKSDFPSKSTVEFDSDQSSHDVDRGSFSIITFSSSQKKIIKFTLVICLATILLPPFENEAVKDFPTSGWRGWCDWWMRSRHTSFILIPPSRNIRGYQNQQIAGEWSINGGRLLTELCILISIGTIGILTVGFIFRKY